MPMPLVGRKSTSYTSSSNVTLLVLELDVALLLDLLPALLDGTEGALTFVNGGAAVLVLDILFADELDDSLLALLLLVVLLSLLPTVTALLLSLLLAELEVALPVVFASENGGAVDSAESALVAESLLVVTIVLVDATVV